MMIKYDESWAEWNNIKEELFSFTMYKLFVKSYDYLY